MDINEKIKDLCGLEILPSGHRRWKPFMEKYNCQTICEIGVSEGINFYLMIEHKPKIAVAIDPWMDDGIISRNDSGYSQEFLDKIFEKFKKNIKDKLFVKIYRGYSFNAVKNFPDEYFDLVYIDADHTYEPCLKDIEDWYPKVKKGGFLTGDDYWDVTSPATGVKFEVIKAVNQFAKTNNFQIYELPEYAWAIMRK